jgi:hypothetical protein
LSGGWSCTQGKIESGLLNSGGSSLDPYVKKKAGRDAWNSGRGKLSGEKERQIVLEFLQENKYVRQKVLCFYLGLSERTVQRWKKNGLKDRRKKV